MSMMLLEKVSDTGDWYIDMGFDPFKKEWTFALMRRAYAVGHRKYFTDWKAFGREVAECYALAFQLIPQETV